MIYIYQVGPTLCKSRQSSSSVVPPTVSSSPQDSPTSPLEDRGWEHNFIFAFRYNNVQHMVYRKYLCRFQETTYCSEIYIIIFIDIIFSGVISDSGDWVIIIVKDIIFSYNHFGFRRLCPLMWRVNCGRRCQTLFRRLLTVSSNLSLYLFLLLF